MAAPRKYPDELRERAIRLTVDARKDPANRLGACGRIGEQLGINPDTLRGWSPGPRWTTAPDQAPPAVTYSGWRSWSAR